MEEENKNDFDRINELYSQYVELSRKINEEDFESKWKVAFKSVKEKIIIDVCKIAFRYFKNLNKFPENKTDSIDEDNYSDTVVEQALFALDTYELSTYKQNNKSFSSYVWINVIQKTGEERSRKIASKNQGGSAISEHEASMIRKINSEDEKLLKFGIKDETSRNKKIAVILSVGIDTVLKYKSLGRSNTISIDQTVNDGGDTFSVLDIKKNLQERNYITPETEYVMEEIKNSLPNILNEITFVYEKKKDPKVSEIFTILLLGAFEKQRAEFIENNNSLQAFLPDIYELLNKYNFVEKSVLTSFFHDKSFNLSTQQEIADKYNMDKSAVSKILQRLREKLLTKEEINEIFDDSIKK